MTNSIFYRGNALSVRTLLLIVLLATLLAVNIVTQHSTLIKINALPASPTAGCAALLNAVFAMKATTSTLSTKPTAMPVT